MALAEPDEYLASVYRFGLLEDFDHMYRYSALMDRVEGKDANTLLQSYTDIIPGRPTSVEHRAPEDELRQPYDKQSAALITKLHANTLMAAEHQTHDYYMTVGPIYPDPIGRQLYAEIATIEEQHVTQYESIILWPHAEATSPATSRSSPSPTRAIANSCARCCDARSGSRRSAPTSFP